MPAAPWAGTRNRKSAVPPGRKPVAGGRGGARLQLDRERRAGLVQERERPGNTDEAGVRDGEAVHRVGREEETLDRGVRRHSPVGVVEGGDEDRIEEARRTEVLPHRVDRHGQWPIRDERQETANLSREGEEIR